MKGIVLAGGSGSRLHPLTRAVSKQLLPVYDKPMIYYPLSVLMLAGIRDILVITTPRDAPLFQRQLGDGSSFGISLSYAEQAHPNGLAEAYVIGRAFLGGGPSCMILGDNLFYGAGLTAALRRATDALDGCQLFGYQVQDPRQYGVAEIDATGRVLSVEEKPLHPRSKTVVTGLYMFDADAVDIAAELTPSARGELEITDLIRAYVRRGRARLDLLGRGMAWLDTGTHESLLEAGELVRVLQHRQGTHIACLEEIAFASGWLDAGGLETAIEGYGDSTYARYLQRLLEGPPSQRGA